VDHPCVVEDEDSMNEESCFHSILVPNLNTNHPHVSTIYLPCSLTTYQVPYLVIYLVALSTYQVPYLVIYLSDNHLHSLCTYLHSIPYIRV
jgi:hypothetical protein